MRPERLQEELRGILVELPPRDLTAEVVSDEHLNRVLVRLADLRRKVRDKTGRELVDEYIGDLIAIREQRAITIRHATSQEYFPYTYFAPGLDKSLPGWAVELREAILPVTGPTMIDANDLPSLTPLASIGYELNARRRVPARRAPIDQTTVAFDAINEELRVVVELCARRSLGRRALLYFYLAIGAGYRRAAILMPLRRYLTRQTGPSSYREAQTLLEWGVVRERRNVDGVLLCGY